MKRIDAPVYIPPAKAISMQWSILLLANNHAASVSQWAFCNVNVAPMETLLEDLLDAEEGLFGLDNEEDDSSAIGALVAVIVMHV